MLTLLLTGAGTPATRGTLYALRCNPDGQSVRVIGVDANADVAARFMVDRFYQIPRCHESNYISTLLEICRNEKVQLILPQTEEEPLILSRNADAFAKEGIAIAASSSEVLERASNKSKLIELFATLQLFSPHTEIVNSADQLIAASRRLGYPAVPVIVKPLNSCGSKGVRLVKENDDNASHFFAKRKDEISVSLNEVAAVLRRSSFCPPLIVQEYLPGTEYTVDAFLGSQAAVAVPRSRQKVLGGTAFETVIEERRDLIAMTLQAAQQLGLKYAFGMQYKLAVDGTPKVLECNPRIQGTMIASLFSGVNLIWLTVQECLGSPPQLQQPALRPASFYRFWGGVAFGEDWMEEI